MNDDGITRAMNIMRGHYQAEALRHAASFLEAAYPVSNRERDVWAQAVFHQSQSIARALRVWAESAENGDADWAGVDPS